MNSMIFMNSYMNACMNSSTSEFRSIWIHETHEFNGHWIHMFSEFINYVLWIRCVLQSCYLLRWDAAALPTRQGSFPVLPWAAQHWQATFHCLEVLLWLCPQWVAFETESRKGCWLNELQLQVAKSRNRMDHLNSPCTHWHKHITMVDSESISD